jgi:hypothetical protein
VCDGVLIVGKGSVGFVGLQRGRRGRERAVTEGVTLGGTCGQGCLD